MRKIPLLLTLVLLAACGAAAPYQEVDRADVQWVTGGPGSDASRFSTPWVWFQPGSQIVIDLEGCPGVRIHLDAGPEFSLSTAEITAPGSAVAQPTFLANQTARVSFPFQIVSQPATVQICSLTVRAIKPAR